MPALKITKALSDPIQLVAGDILQTTDIEMEIYPGASDTPLRLPVMAPLQVDKPVSIRVRALTTGGNKFTLSIVRGF